VRSDKSECREETLYLIQQVAQVRMPRNSRMGRLTGNSECMVRRIFASEK